MFKKINIFRAVLETTPDTVLIIDENNVVVFCNENIKKTFGYEPKYLIDKDMNILIPFELREGHNKGMKRFISSGVPKLIGKTIEIIGLHKNGTTFPIELSLSFWKENGKIFFSSIIRDISERKRILKEKDDLNIILKEEKKEKQALLEELLVSEEELRASYEELNSTSEQLKNLNENLEKEVVLRTNQVLRMNNDLTNKNKELKRLNVDLDNFIYTASHDLKTPVVNLEGLFYHLKNEFGGRFDLFGKNLIEMMEKSIEQLHKTIFDLTQITIAQKDLNSDFSQISFKEIVNDVLCDLQPIIDGFDVVIEKNIQAETIYFNRSSIRSIIYNLLTNALKYKSPKRPLRIVITATNEASNFVLSIKDNGLGIAKHQLPKMFSMFKRFHSHVEGTGIGLYIIKRMIENHEGSISVESEEGEGSTFKVIIPLPSID